MAKPKNQMTENPPQYTSNVIFLILQPFFNNYSAFVYVQCFKGSAGPRGRVSVNHYKVHLCCTPIKDTLPPSHLYALCIVLVRFAEPPHIILPRFSSWIQIKPTFAKLVHSLTLY